MASFYICEKGYLWGWGSNDDGQLGLGDYKKRNKPVKIINDKEFLQVAACGEHMAAIDIDGFLWSCGLNGGWPIGIWG